jgi:uncharacterized repeat protein (TIGR01451 family)
MAAPAVTTISPAQGPPGTQVTITGTGFSTATNVFFTVTTLPADFMVTSDTRMVAVVPPDAVSGQIHVRNPTGDGASGGNFLVSPRITDFAPGRSATNMVVTINGFNFESATNVQFNGGSAQFAITAPGQIRATVPFGATNGPITVSTLAGSDVSQDDFVVTGPAPVIDFFFPTVGAPGTIVQIRGVNFATLASVKFNGMTSPSFSAPADTQINAQVPASATTGKISVTTSGGTVTSTNNFTVTRGPVITDFSPKVGKVGTPVLIEGINFTNITGIGFNGNAVTGWGTPAPGQINVSVPSAATTGPITVTNSFGVGISADDFVITQAPIVESADTLSGPPGVNVVIRGVNFATSVPTTRVFFNGKQATTFNVAADTQINATVPTGATSGPITVTNSFGSGVSSFDFLVTGGGPRITRLDPGRGPKGSVITIHGENFVNVTAVRFNGVNAVSPQAPAPTMITAAVPNNATTGPITVTTTTGTSTNANIFYVPPWISSFTPTNGVAGSSVVVTGANFVGVTDFLFNSAASSYTVNASNRLTAVIPTNATTGPITVETPGGVIISANSFRVLPNITGFNPTIGPVGTVVTITGTTFLNVTGVSFNNVAATPTSVTSTQIVVAVPPNATTGPIRVTTADGVATSAATFTVSGPSDLRLDLTASASTVRPGQQLTYSVSVMNDGPAVVTGVVMTNELPAGMDYVSAVSSRGTISESGGVVTCNLGVLTNTASATITITVNAVTEGIWTDSAGVAAVESDPFPSNNSWFVTTTVVSDQSRTLQITNTPGPGSVTISWPTSAVPFTLQSASGLSGGITWSNVTNGVIVSGGRNSVTNSATGTNRYYRLRRP